MSYVCGLCKMLSFGGHLVYLAYFTMGRTFLHWSGPFPWGDACPQLTQCGIGRGQPPCHRRFLVQSDCVRIKGSKEYLRKLGLPLGIGKACACTQNFLRHLPVSKHEQKAVINVTKSIGNRPSRVVKSLLVDELDRVDRQNSQVDRCIRLNRLPTVSIVYVVQSLQICRGGGKFDRSHYTTTRRNAVMTFGVEKLQCLKRGVAAGFGHHGRVVNVVQSLQICRGANFTGLTTPLHVGMLSWRLV